MSHDIHLLKRAFLVFVRLVCAPCCLT